MVKQGKQVTVTGLAVFIKKPIKSRKKRQS